VPHISLAELQAGVETIRRSPRDAGVVALIVRRPEVEAREVLGDARLDETEGLLGDCWRARGSRSSKDGLANPDAQITLMNARSAALIAGSPEHWALAGDQLYVDLDLSEANLPPGSRLEVGEALLEVTALPHRGCGKFLRRFGAGAAKFVNSPVGRELNIRGINARVVRGGIVRTGDEVRKQADYERAA
jgi:hypothetical protein